MDGVSRTVTVFTTKSFIVVHVGLVSGYRRGGRTLHYWRGTLAQRGGVLHITESRLFSSMVTMPLALTLREFSAPSTRLTKP